MQLNKEDLKLHQFKVWPIQLIKKEKTDSRNILKLTELTTKMTINNIQFYHKTSLIEEVNFNSKMQVLRKIKTLK